MLQIRSEHRPSGVWNDKCRCGDGALWELSGWTDYACGPVAQMGNYQAWQSLRHASGAEIAGLRRLKRIEQFGPGSADEVATIVSW